MVRKQKGAVTLLVVITVLFMFVVLTAAFYATTSMRETQLQSDLQIKEDYEKEINQIEDVYANLIASGNYNNITD